MEEIQNIYSTRQFEKAFHWKIVFEWEDIIAREMGLHFVYGTDKLKKVQTWFTRFYNHIPHVSILTTFFIRLYNLFLKSKGITIFYQMDTLLYYYELYNRKDMVPIMIDFWLKDEEIPDFVRKHNQNPYIGISSRQVFDKLMAMNLNKCFFHCPLTLSDSYALTQTTRYEKKYNLTIIGGANRNPYFMPFINKYKEEYPDFSYIVGRVNQEDNTVFYETDKGEFVCNANSREEYIDLIRKSKIVLYTTPGIGGRKNSNGYDQVTPRFLEFVAGQCHILAHYSTNSDTDYFELSKFSPDITDYETFESELEKKLKEKPDYDMYYSYMKKHYTSSILPILNNLQRKNKD